MTYETKSLGDVFDAIQRGRGYGGITMGDTERLRTIDLINRAGKTAWKQRVWPDFTEIQRRTYRPPWVADQAYSEDQEVWRLGADGLSGHYYRAIVDNLGVDPQDGAAPDTWMQDPTDMRLYIQYDQPWEETLIDGVQLEAFASWDDPTYVRNPVYVQGLWLVQRSVMFSAPSSGLDQGQVVPAGAARGMPARPWIRFRPPWPMLGAKLWDVAEEVAMGALRYRTQTGQCYVALRPSTGAIPEESPDDWTERGVPEFFATYIELWCIGQRQAEDEGKWKTLQMAADELSDMEDEAIVMPGVPPRAGFFGR